MVQIKQYVANPLVLILIITAGGLLLAGKFWDRYRATLQAEPTFALSTDKIQLTATPVWLPAGTEQRILHLVTKANSNANLTSPSLLSPNLVSEVAKLLQQDPWIDQVLEVRKKPTHLEVQVVYGKPLLLELPQQKVVLINPRGEPMGTSELSAEVTEKALRVAARDLVQSPIQFGQPWPDRRVILSAELARLLGPVQESGGLAGIYSYYLAEAPAGPGTASTPALQRPVEFRLWTLGRNEIIWGSPVGQELTGEATAAQKITGLVQFVRVHGPIDQGRDLPAARGNVLDLRSGELVLVKNAKQASEFAGSYR
jgi:hypothetical protein